MARPKPVKVLYIAGWGRSGSTLLDLVLGQIHGFTSVGELRYVWDRGLLDNDLCGCGAPFRECAFWQAVFDAAFGGFDGVDAREMLRLRSDVDLARYDGWLLIGGPRHNGLRRRAEPYRAAMAQLLRAIHDVSGCGVIVDSSKTPCHGAVLLALANVELYVLHLVRDARAVAFSWRRQRRVNDRATEFAQHSLRRSALMWLVENAAAHRFEGAAAGYCLMRYEDFVAEAKTQVLRAVRMIGPQEPDLSFIGSASVTLRARHGISGNPAKFITGEVSLRRDDDWHVAMTAAQKNFISLITAPLLLRYAYHLRG
jgi:hypothetical protein